MRDIFNLENTRHSTAERDFLASAVQESDRHELSHNCFSLDGRIASRVTWLPFNPLWENTVPSALKSGKRQWAGVSI
jgi:hypothetical protein